MSDSTPRTGARLFSSVSRHGEQRLPEPAAGRRGGPGQGGRGGDPPQRGGQLRGAAAGGEPEPAGHRPAEEEVRGDGGRAEEDPDEGQEERWAFCHDAGVYLVLCVVKLVTRDPYLFFFRSVLSSCSREILSFSENSAQQRESKRRVGC